MKALVDWFDRNWENYVATSFLFRNDPTKTAADLGYRYLPQECVSRPDFEAYRAGLSPIAVEEVAEAGIFDLDGSSSQECATGACPTR
jgi:ribonucleoside-triphosphate reductase